jgi:hypothetical protein
MRLGTPWLSLGVREGAVTIETPRRTFEADFVIAGTGFAVDLRLRPELSGIAPHVALWADRYAPPDDERDVDLARYPYTGPAYELIGRGGAAPAELSQIHLFNHGSLVSNGPTAGGLNGMPFGLPRLLRGLTRDLYLAEADRIYAGLVGYGEADPWAASAEEIDNLLERLNLDIDQLVEEPGAADDGELDQQRTEDQHHQDEAAENPEHRSSHSLAARPIRWRTCLTLGGRGRCPFVQRSGKPVDKFGDNPHREPRPAP